MVTEWGNGHGVECQEALYNTYGKNYLVNYLVPATSTIEDDPCAVTCGSPTITNPSIPAVPTINHDYNSDGIYELSAFTSIDTNGVTNCDVAYEVT